MKVNMEEQRVSNTQLIELISPTTTLLLAFSLYEQINLVLFKLSSDESSITKDQNQP